MILRDRHHRAVHQLHRHWWSGRTSLALRAVSSSASCTYVLERCRRAAGGAGAAGGGSSMVGAAGGASGPGRLRAGERCSLAAGMVDREAPTQEGRGGGLGRNGRLGSAYSSIYVREGPVYVGMHRSRG